MKHSFTCLLLLFAINNGFSQLQYTDSVNISRERWRDSLFRIDKSQVPTGILTEYSLFPFDTNKYDGLNNDDDTVKTEGQIFMLHNILSTSIVNTNAAVNITDSLYAMALNYYNTNQSIPFIFIYKPYNRIRPTALAEGLFTIAADSVGILDVAGRAVSPYNAYNIFAFSAFKTFVTQYNAINFSFPAALWETGSVSSISIDFGDGAGFRTINQNDNLSIYYDAEGVKTLTAQITVNGIILTARSTITYGRPAAFIQPTYQWNIDTVARVYTSDNNYLGINNQVQPFGIGDSPYTLGATTGANVLVENGCDGVFDKPVIIVEGFDPGDKVDAVILSNRFRNSSFISTLKAYGYDLVYVDFKNNRDYIENNAKVLEAIINKINQVKTGTNKISIIGFSMGGLVTRWCLKDMEDRGLTHNVDKYFSYDAPHQGANIPLGCQYLFKEIIRDLPYLRWFNAGSTGDVAGMRDLDDAFDSPAGRQMLITKASYNNSAFNWNPNLNTLDPLRAAFAQRLQSKGYPQQTTNYGIAFGDGNNPLGTKNAGNGFQWGNFQPGSLIFSGGMNWFLAGFNATVRAVPENNNQAAICNYYFAGLTFRKIFGIPFPAFTIRVRNFNYIGQYPYDDAPGGYETTQSDFASSLSGIANGIAPDATTNGHNGHCFVPVASSLDLQNQSYSASTNWQSANMFYNIDNSIQNPFAVTGGTLSNPALSPFTQVVTATSYYGYNAAYNQYHNGNIQYQFADFMLNKILGFAATPDCNTDGFCSLNPTITGPAVVCSTGVFTATGLPSGLKLVWGSSNGLFKITAGQGTNQVTISRLSGTTNGSDVLTLSLTNSCGTTRQISYNISVGSPAPTYINYSIDPLVACNEVSVSTSYVTGSTYTWSYFKQPYSSNLVQFPNSSATKKLTLTQGSGTYNIGVTADNTCGSSSIYFISVPISCSTVGGHSIIKQKLTASITEDNAIEKAITEPEVYPNPATNNLTVAVPASAKQLYNNSVALFDMHGKAVKKVVLNAQVTHIDISGLATGTYIVKIFDGKQTVVKKIVKN